MSAFIVKVHNGYFYKGQKTFETNNGKTLIVNAKTGASYELIQKYSGRGPEQVLVEKRGNNLLVAFESKFQIDLVIRDFFLYPESQLVGMGQNGEYYSYLPIQDQYEEFFGKELWVNDQQEGEAQIVELGSYGKVTPWILEAETQPLFELIKPALYGLGGAGLLLLGAGNFKKANTKPLPEPTPDPTPERPETPEEASISDDGQTVTGKAQPNTDIEIQLDGNVIGRGRTNDQGDYNITLNNAQTNGEELQIIAVNGTARSSARDLTSVDTTAPEPASSAQINDLGTIVTGVAEAGAQVQVLDQYDNVIGTGAVRADGNYTVNLPQAQNHEEALKVRVKDGGDNLSSTINLTGASGENTSISDLIDVDTTAEANRVAEDIAIGSVVGITAKASDYEAVTYSIINGNGDFVIDANTGVITTAKTLDFETKQQHTIRVRASSADGSNTERSFALFVNNVNDNDISEAKDTNTAQNFVLKSADIGSSVGVTINASDADDGNASTVTYKFLDNPDSLFSINVETGEVTTAKSFAGEVGQKTIRVQATSADGTTSEISTVIDVLDTPPSTTPVTPPPNTGSDDGPSQPQARPLNSLLQAENLYLDDNILNSYKANKHIDSTDDVSLSSLLLSSLNAKSDIDMSTIENTQSNVNTSSSLNDLPSDPVPTEVLNQTVQTTLADTNIYEMKSILFNIDNIIF